MKYPLPSDLEMAGYAAVYALDLGIVQLGRNLDELSYHEAVLRRRGDALGAAGAANLLRTALLQMAAAPATDQRLFSRKERALSADRIAASGLGPLGADMIRAALDADRANLRIAATAAAADARAQPDPDMMETFAKQVVRTTFLSALAENEVLRHDQAFLAARGDRVGAEGVAARRALDLVRPASRPAATREEAAMKIELVREMGIEQPILSAMLAAAVEAERRTWDLGTFRIAWTDEDDRAPPGAAERCARYARGLDPTSIEPWISVADNLYRDFETLMLRGGDRAAGCFHIIVDLGLMVAAIPAASKPQADRKLEFVADLRPALSDVYPIASAMLDAAIRIECDVWGVLLIEAAGPTPPGGG